MNIGMQPLADEAEFALRDAALPIGMDFFKSIEKLCGIEVAKDTVERADPKLRHKKQPASLRSQVLHRKGRCQSQAINEEGVIEGWVNDSSALHNRCGSR